MDSSVASQTFTVPANRPPADPAITAERDRIRLADVSW